MGLGPFLKFQQCEFNIFILFNFTTVYFVKIDFLSVDVEGLDLQVLESNDWDKYRPRVVLAEVLGASLNTIKQDPVYKYLTNQGYILFSKLIHTCIFKIDE